MRKKIFLSFLALSCALLVLLTGVLVFGAYRLEQRQLAESLATEADTLPWKPPRTTPPCSPPCP